MGCNICRYVIINLELEHGGSAWWYQSGTYYVKRHILVSVWCSMDSVCICWLLLIVPVHAYSQPIEHVHDPIPHLTCICTYMTLFPIEHVRMHMTLFTWLYSRMYMTHWTYMAIKHAHDPLPIEYVRIEHVHEPIPHWNVPWIFCMEERENHDD